MSAWVHRMWNDSPSPEPPPVVMRVSEYEAKAATVKVEDITSDDSNQAILRKLKEDDPNFDTLPRNCAELGWVGYFIRSNTHLRALTIGCENLIGSYFENVPFCDGVNRNSSIRSLSFCGLRADETLSSICLGLRPLLRKNENLSRLRVLNCHLDTPSSTPLDMALAIESGYKSLKSVSLYNYFARIVGALEKLAQLEELRLSYLDMGESECRALSTLLQSAKLTKLDLYFNKVGDGGLIALVNLLHNATLKTLKLASNSGKDYPGGAKSITNRGWQSLSAFLANENCTLEELSLCYNDIGDEGAQILANALTRNCRLKRLEFDKCSITQEGWAEFSRAVRDKNQLRDLWLVNVNTGINACMVSSLLPTAGDELYELKLSRVAGTSSLCEVYGFEHSQDDENLLDDLHGNRLKMLDLGNNDFITPRGWRDLATLLQNTCPGLEELHLNFCNIDDEKLVDLVNALQTSELQVLNLSDDPNVTARGWICVASLIEDTRTHLSQLLLDRNNIGDNEVRVLANSLTGNSTLEKLSLVGNPISGEGWKNFKTVVCDASTINKTFLSNHTLSNLYNYTTTPTLSCNLALNGSEMRKSEVAMVKILNRHLHFDMSVFFEWEYKILPYAVNWFDRAASIDYQEDEAFDPYFNQYSDTEDEESMDGYANDTFPSDLGRDRFVATIYRRQFDCIFQFMRAMPDVFAPDPKTGRKRKFALTYLAERLSG